MRLMKSLTLIFMIAPSTICLDDLHLLATRAEIARWVYSNFTEETGLNLETVATMLSRQRPKTGSWAAKTAVKQREGDRVHPISLLFRELPLIQHVLENISDSLPQCQFHPFFLRTTNLTP